ncbi:hypothetical protein CFT12S00416_07925 [Campylobacter fetus subsp. testudinum]|uniref:PcfJ domain-containing protein n=2 Tax=Campylobacter fetus TaxID=196 RepID=UPI000818AEF1|nr:PcfJ domain-containing protein [Campylobacter fetus]OCR87745.1 hypothetical protein CFT12S00416_07925 [Campylobacter fetus subsp. testudinum]
MPFFNKHLEFQAGFDKNILANYPEFISIIQKMRRKFYPLYQDENCIHLLNANKKLIKTLDTNYDVLHKFIKEIRPIKCEALSIFIKENELVISTFPVTFINSTNKFIFLKQSKSKLKFYIKDKYSIFISNEYKGKFGFYEANLNSISKICQRSILMHYFFDIYFLHLVKSHPQLKDIQIDFKNDPISIKSPFKFSSLEKFINKKLFFINKYPKEIFLNSVNQNSLHTTYMILKIKKYIPAPYFNEITNFVLQNFNKFIISSFSKPKDFAKEILTKYLLSKIFVESKLGDYRDIIYDYVDMALEQKESINLKIKSFRRIKAEHDRLMLNTEIKYVPEVKISDENPFLTLKLPKDIKMLTTKKEIVEEGIANRNCVASYIKKINDKKCFICSLRRNDKRYTIEIGRQRNKFYLAQISGLSNSPAPNAVVEYVNNAIYKKGN